ncbi:23S rRNA (adenine(2503)-C(2))-methyltransferase RlmN [Lachnospiraceae bacterium NSJ-29]|uniref:Probable dual-specificity RNA methyltransferase RlmN n=1 Tax=Wansuia hejianensis TaxID=2763667 RepID=A0A926IN93_9FIRM|nr:23S rRNA (adenine(2503)-C(2))-methyltransferase RlmN [Wansuia hejianensis]
MELNSLTLDETKEFVLSLGQKSYRGEQLFSSLNRHKILDIQKIHQLPKEFRDTLETQSRINKIKILNRFDSKVDDTKKFLYLLEDNNIIESVYMKYDHGNSICISTQVGCRMGCSFCASTKEGRIRNLTAAEMLNQIYIMENDLNLTIDNIVLMGSGEPLDNYENTLKFLNIIHDPKGHNTSYRNITLSTCGIIPRIYDLGREGVPITLSISLHSPFDQYRSQIMPISKKYKINELMEACKFYTRTNNRRLTFEYTLIEGINDREEDINELVKILKGINAHINLIPLNPIKEYNMNRPSKNNVEIFYKKLKKIGIPVTIRKEKGADISASCGQLRRDYLDKTQPN